MNNSYKNKELYNTQFKITRIISSGDALVYIHPKGVLFYALGRPSVNFVSAMYFRSNWRKFRQLGINVNCTETMCRTQLRTYSDQCQGHTKLLWATVWNIVTALYLLIWLKEIEIIWQNAYIPRGCAGCKFKLAEININVTRNHV